jgi:prevent-host-death family protein
MVVVNMHVARSNLSRLAQRAAGGEDIVIAKNGKPVARLTRLAPARSGTLLGAFSGKIRMSKNFDEIPAEFRDYV